MRNVSLYLKPRVLDRIELVWVFLHVALLDEGTEFTKSPGNSAEQEYDKLSATIQERVDEGVILCNCTNFIREVKPSCCSCNIGIYFKHVAWYWVEGSLNTTATGAVAVGREYYPMCGLNMWKRGMHL